MIKMSGHNNIYPPDFRRIYFKQAGGKYATFTCPNCGKPGQDFKVTQSAGWCEACKYHYQLAGDYGKAGKDIDQDYYNFYSDLEIIG